MVLEVNKSFTLIEPVSATERRKRALHDHPLVRMWHGTVKCKGNKTVNSCCSLRQYVFCMILRLGRAVAQAVIRWLPGFASGQHVGFVVDKAALGQVFFEYFGFPCQSFHQFLHHHNHLRLAQ
jgi:hypothetical protein